MPDTPKATPATKTNEELVYDLINAVRDVSTAPLGDKLLAANQALPIARKAVLDRMK